MKEFLKNMKISFILTALIYVALGVVLLFWPDMTSTILCFTLGIALTVYGALLIIGFFAKGDSNRTFQFELMVGIIAAAIGLFALIRPDAVLKILPITFGVIILIDSFVNLKRTLELHQMGYEKWWVVLILALLTAALALLVIFNPFGALNTLIMVIGGILIYQGISDLWAISRISKAARAA
ncbi:MAG: DUF308 domain-containing protein [Oscillospiraceae bacterium]